MSLPNELDVELEDGRRATVGINWDTSNYDGTVVGTNTLIGSLINLPQTVSNPNDLTAEIVAEVADLAEYTLTINTEGAGSTLPESGSYTYIDGTEVALEAQSSSLYMLDSWTGDINTTDKETQVLIDSDKTVTASFVEKYTVSSVESLSSITVSSGTTFENLSLPNTVNFILADEWATGINYEVGDVVLYNSNYYEVLQAHTSQSDWTPDSAVSLYDEIQPNQKTNRSLEVSWLKGNYDSNVDTQTTYTVEGVPLLDSDIANPNDLSAYIDITVGP